jgi:hypothetical protein
MKQHINQERAWLSIKRTGRTLILDMFVQEEKSFTASKA